MEGIVIRPARASDADELAQQWIDTARHFVELDPQAFRVPSTDGLVEFLEELLRRPRSDDSVWLVAEGDGRVMGDISARLERPAEGAEYQVVQYLGEVRVYVDALGVGEAYRRRGVGTRLMKAVEQWARDRGAVCAMLDTYATSPLSVPFYERGMGYRRRSIIFEKRLGVDEGDVRPSGR
jgi:GNAT superfamily N-acetyltransferase